MKLPPHTLYRSWKPFSVASCFLLMKQPILFVLFSCLLAYSLSAQEIYQSGIKEIRLEIGGSNWAERLDSLKRDNPEGRLPGTLFLAGTRYDSVGIRFKGNSSYFRTSKKTLKKLPFNIKVDFKKKNQRFGKSYTSLKLSNAFLDPSFIRDPLSYEVVRSYMPAPLCNFAQLTVNKEPYGLYVNTESIDEAFIQKHFGYSGGHLVKCDPDQWQRVRSQGGCPKGENASLMYLSDSPGCYEAFYEVESPEAWPYLINLTKILNKQPARIEEFLNIDQTLWMLALNNVMVNLDSYNGSLSHNYYLWFDTLGMAHPLIWDLNMSFGGWRRNMSFEEMSDEQLIKYQPLAEIGNSRRPLISILLKNPFYRKVYLAHVKTIQKDWLASGWLEQRALAMKKEIDLAVKQDQQKLYSYSAFQNSLDSTMTDGPDHIIGIRELMNPRNAFLAAHPLLNKPAPAVKTPVTTVKDSIITCSIQAENATRVVFFYRAKGEIAFHHQDCQLVNDLWTIQLPTQKVANYYLVAENAEAATCIPEKTSWAPIQVGKK